MKSICLIASAVILTSMSSCSLIGSILKIPGGLLKAVGRTVGVSGLTDEKADPVDESSIIEAPKTITPDQPTSNLPSE